MATEASEIYKARWLPPVLPICADRLDQRIREGRLGRSHVSAVARQLEERHRASGCGDAGAHQGTAEKLASEIRLLCGRLREQADGAATTLDGVEASLRAFLLVHSDRLRSRVLGERIVGVHGHLAADRVSVAEDSSVILSEPFRSPLGSAFGDVTRDLVDLYGELELAADPSLAERLLAAYSEAALDYRLYGVFDFHRRLQALRRWAWYAAARPNLATESEQARTVGEIRQARQALESVREAPVERPLLVATGGWVGTGKSTVSRTAAEALGAPRIEVDRMRQGVIDAPPVEPLRPGGGDRESDWERNFAPGFTDAVYAELFRQARVVTESGRHVVLDGCFGQRHLRDAAAWMAAEGGARFVFLECRLDRALHAKRIAERERQRGSEPGAWSELAAEFEQRWQPTRELSAEVRHVFDTSRDPASVRRQVSEVIAACREGG